MNKPFDDLYEDLALTVPAGIYRIRTLPDFVNKKYAWKGTGNTPYEFEYVNKQFCEMFNIAEEAAYNDPGIILSFIHPDDLDSFSNTNIKAGETHRDFYWQGRVIINSEVRFFSFKSVPRILENKVVIWTGMVQDQTREVQDAELIKSANMDLINANHQIEQILSIIAHDLRNPLHTIMGFSEMIKDSSPVPEIGEMSEHIFNISKTSSSTLEGLLQWLIGTSDQINSVLEDISIKDLLKDLKDMLKFQAYEKKLEIKISAGEDDNVTCDRALVTTVLRNLVTNSIKFSEPGKSIFISGKTKNNEFHLTVRDQGVGMDQETTNRLFEVSKSKSKPGTRNEQGAGLGLVICNDIVNKLKGRIEVSSKLGSGTQIDVFFPLK